MIDLSFEKETKRLVLRLYRESDYEMWRDTYASLPKSKNRWDGGPQPLENLTMSAFRKILDAQAQETREDRYYRLNAFEKQKGRLIGQFSLMDISREIFQNAYLGYGVFSPFWRQGYGKEDSAAILEVAFKTLRLHRVEAGVEPNNKRSIALAKSLNMRREGTSKRRLLLGGRWADITIYAITAEELGCEARD